MSFVTTVTCARYIKGNYPSFLYIRGDFASEHVARVSDNGDRMQGKDRSSLLFFKFAAPTFCNPIGVSGRLNLIFFQHPKCSISEINPLYIAQVFHLTGHQKQNLASFFGNFIKLCIIWKCVFTNYFVRKNYSSLPKILHGFSRDIIRRDQHQYDGNISHTETILTVDPFATISSRVRSGCQQSGHSDFQIRLKFRTKRYSSDSLSRVRSCCNLQAACDFQQGGSTHICPILPLPKITKYDILLAC
jgi:hypothetical protein